MNTKKTEAEEVKKENIRIVECGDRFIKELSTVPGSSQRTLFFVGLYMLCRSAQWENLSQRDALRLVRKGLKKAKIK